MRHDYAMAMIDRMLSRAGPHAPSEPIDPTLRAKVDRLIGEIRAIEGRRRTR